MEGLDYSWGRPDPATLYQWGYRFVVRYVALGSLDKLLSAPEARILTENGLAVVCVAEGVERQASNGYSQGFQDARAAYGWAQLVGMPAERPVYLAVDFDIQPWELEAVGAYFDGAADGIGIERVGAYGSYRLVEYLANTGRANWYWQTYAWSYGAVSQWANLYQYDNDVTVAGADVDRDRNLTDDFGQWGAGLGVAVPVPPPPPADTSGLPDVRADGPWDFTPHIDALADSYAGLAVTLDGAAGAVASLRI